MSNFVRLTGSKTSKCFFTFCRAIHRLDFSGIYFWQSAIILLIVLLLLPANTAFKELAPDFCKMLNPAADLSVFTGFIVSWS